MVSVILACSEEVKAKALSAGFREETVLVKHNACLSTVEGKTHQKEMEKLMSDHTFFSTDNRQNERLIRILSVGSLVSKPPTKEKRISIKARMALSGSTNLGSPEWLENSFLFVSKNHDKVVPNIEFKGFSIDFSIENLFGEAVSSRDTIMRAFEIAEFGDAENPDVAMTFTIRMQFSTKRWDWLGQFVGEEVWAKFVPGEAGVAVPAGEEDGTTLDDGNNEQGEDEGDAEGEEEGQAEEPDDPRLAATPTKSGPKELAAFHEGEVQKEEARGRKKKVTDF